MFDAKIEKEKIRLKLEHVYVGHDDLKKVEEKIEATKEVIRGLKISISHSRGISKVLLEWQLESYEENLLRFEILYEVTRERFLEMN